MFCLFYVPHVVFSEVLSLLGLNDLTCLALCSQRAYLLVKHLRYKSPKLEIHMRSDANGFMTIVKLQGKELLTLRAYSYPCKEMVKIQRESVPFFRTKVRGWILLDYDDKVRGFQKMTEFVLDLFSTNLHMVEFGNGDMWMLNWVKKGQNSLFGARINDWTALTNEDYEQLLTNCNTDNLCLLAPSQKSFKLDKPFQEHKLSWINFGNWITIENLLSMKSAEIEIENSKLTSSDVNQFLKAWEMRGILIMKWVRFKVIDFNYEIALHGLNVELTEKHVECFLKSSLGKELWFYSDYSIKREDGAQAFISYMGGKFCFSTAIN